MYIDIFEITSKYRGIERNNDILLSLSNRQARKYLNLLDNDAKILFTNSNYNILRCLMNTVVSKIGNKYEIIAFGNSSVLEFCKLCNNAKFLGYDITGDSYNESPIFRAVFDDSDDIHSIIGNYLNEYGLCSTVSDCNKIIEYIKDNNNNFFENDGVLHHVSVFSLK